MLTICADDIGLDPAINEASLNLFAQHRLSAISVMIDAPFVTPDAWHQARKEGLQVGLYLNLTSPFHPSDFVRPIQQWLFLTYANLVKVEEVARVLSAQIDRFVTTFGYEPDFIDGHEHIHQLPIIREALLTILEKHYGNQSSKKPWIRTPVRPTCVVDWPSPIKCFLLENLGGIALQQSLIKASWPHSAGFMGVYHFGQSILEMDYRQRMRCWLNAVKEIKETRLTDSSSLYCPLLICHPAYRCIANDAISHHRFSEYTYLMSEAFLEDLAEFKVIISPFY